MVAWGDESSAPSEGDQGPITIAMVLPKRTHSYGIQVSTDRKGTACVYLLVCRHTQCTRMQGMQW